MRALRAALVALVLAAGFAGTSGGPAIAQVETPILTLDQEALFLRSAFGQRLRDEISQASAELAAENGRIQAALVAEEQDLTERRATLPADEFRALATAFDAKVRSLRAEQDAKTRAINQASDDAQQVFFSRVATILSEIMGDLGAFAILDARSVLLATEAIDVTEIAIARIDAALGDGRDDAPSPDAAIQPEPEAPAPAPEPEAPATEGKPDTPVPAGD